MALISCRFFSDALGFQNEVMVILPEKFSKEPLKTLYLLHGYSDDHTRWQRQTSIERYVENLNLAVVMPNVHRSYYTDTQYDYHYWRFISDELPQKMRQFFPLSERRENNFVAGLSMGGYGAAKLGLRCPDKYAAFATLSGALHLALLEEESVQFDIDLQIAKEFKWVFGEKLTGTENDTIHLLKKVAGSDEKPFIYQCCGTADFLYPMNVVFRNIAVKEGYDITYTEEEGADHNWTYWDAKIKDVLDWLQEKGLVK
ncbi:alpha/beta hydrolase [Vallitalea okinawensis]|uniref:alpha/beta hydrolase n=1 Tax=Vallitalea okinawensis TaxID=2078660 RepID=UPI000CFAB2AC|nr:alpha/beta hydrolase family protein [Vallitalea okinawensis]